MTELGTKAAPPTAPGAFAPAVAAIRARTAVRPVVAIILGSGLGALGDQVEDAVRIPYAEIPGWKRSTAPGHAGELVVGTIARKPVAVMKGRLHYYEGYDIADVAYPVRVFKAWGIDTLIITNACGGLNPAFKAGDLMVISDHINLMAANPLRGINDDRLGPRFPDMVGTYTEELRKIAHEVDGDLREGIYVAVAGPNFETPAELRMLRGLGADAVGMSTVPEVLVARHQGMRILAISTVTDMATGIPGQIEHVTHEQVLEVAERAGKRLARVVTEVVARL
jgi:purine-nucleoside phosphorylase